MKKSVRIILFSVLAAAVVLLSGIAVFVIETNKTDGNNNEINLFDSYYIYRSDNVHSKIYMKSEEGNKTVDSAWIYKFAFDKDRKIIAYRRITAFEGSIYNLDEQNDIIYHRYYAAEEYGVSDDLLMLYDCTEKKYLEFESDEELILYCTANSIELCNWYYPAGSGFIQAEKNPISGDYYQKTWIYGYSSIMCGENELFFGYISDIKTEENIISFRLRQTKNEYSPEQMTANSGLSEVSKNPTGKYRNGFLDYNNVYYDKIITINTVTKEITEKDK